MNDQREALLGNCESRDGESLCRYLYIFGLVIHKGNKYNIEHNCLYQI